MVLGSILVGVGVLCQTISLLVLSKTISIKGSIKGLSYDWISFTALSHSTRLLVTCCYGFSEAIQIQNARRSPALPPVTVSAFIMVADLIGLIAAIHILYQIKVYHRSKILNQGYSLGLKACLIGCYVVVPLLVFKFYIFRGVLQLVDVVDWFWLCHNVISMVSFCPQLIMNWFHNLCTTVIPIAYDKWQGLSVCFLILGRALDHIKWPLIPVNWPSWPLILASAILFMCLEIQRYVYSR